MRLGAISGVSALLAQYVVAIRLKKKSWFTYNLHADIDKQHAQEFFKIIESHMHNPEQKEKVMLGLHLGAYIFNRLYEDLYQEAKSCLS